jgi:hypothetical protein
MRQAYSDYGAVLAMAGSLALSVAAEAKDAVCSVAAISERITVILRHERDMLTANEFLQDLAKNNCVLADHGELSRHPNYVRSVQFPKGLQHRFSDGKINIGVGVRGIDSIVASELSWAKHRKTAQDNDW